MKKIWLSTIILIFAGIVSSGTGIWFIVGDFPFDRTGFADKMDISKEELLATNPEIVMWATHTTNQLGSVSMGWGLFIIALAWLGIRKNNRYAWYALWVGGVPTLLYSAIKEIVRYGVLDTGSILNITAFLLFFLGMLLPVKSFLGKNDSSM